jgi:hypothetical protein
MQTEVGELQKANWITVEANRPWIGAIPGPKSDLTTETLRNQEGEFEEFTYIWRLKNAGKRPARVTSIATAGDWYTECPTNPDYKARPKGTEVFPGRYQEASSRAFVIPETEIYSIFSNPIPIDKWKMIEGSDGLANISLMYCIYVSIEYQDTIDSTVTHHTRDCRIFIPHDHAAAECHNTYPDAD